MAFHHQIQRSRGSDYQAEFPVSLQRKLQHYRLNVGGRIDGLFIDNDIPVIEEIKTFRSDPRQSLPGGLPQHWAQGQMYAYMYGQEQSHSHLAVQLTYGFGRKQPPYEIRKTYTFAELQEIAESILTKYIYWLDQLAEWQMIRDASISALIFPHPTYRIGQREMAVYVYRAIRDKVQLLVQAPTGIGKTLAALFPAVKALGEGAITKLFFLAARTTGKQVAMDTLATFQERGLRLKSSILTARDKICFEPDAGCTGDECPYSAGYYDRLEEALKEGFKIDLRSRETVENLAQKYMLCPFELSLDLSLSADVIVADYNYAFDPQVYLRRFFQNNIIFGRKMEYLFLVDEAHNLVDRARNMHSESISKAQILELRRQIKKRAPALYRDLGKMNRQLLGLHHKCTAAGKDVSQFDLPHLLVKHLRGMIHTAEKWLSQQPARDLRRLVVEHYFEWVNLLRVAEQYNSHYVTLLKLKGKDLQLTFFCMDPAPFLADSLKRSKSTVFFSATLSPTEYFSRLLGCDQDTLSTRLPSPFPSKNLGVFLLNSISTRFRDRQQTSGQVVQALVAICRQSPGNYLFFFPSYRYMTTIHELFLLEGLQAEILIQDRNFSERERDQFLTRFSAEAIQPVIGFAVLGGAFGEGIDLVGDRLTGVAIVGVGLPGITLEAEAIRSYFNRENQGYLMAYQIPGMIRVLQAAGRVIRTESDRGIVAIIDERITSSVYQRLQPDHWTARIIRHPFQFRKELHQFWEDEITR